MSALPAHVLTPAEIAAWHRDGFVLRRAVFAIGETERLLADADLAMARCRDAARSDAAQYFTFANADSGSASIAAGLDHSGTAFEALCRDPRVIDPVFQLFGEQQYIHHAKLMNKTAFTGIAWLWHQDYGYWQDIGSVRPDMVSAMVFLDAARRDNGCLLVMPGSHRRGRHEHRCGGDTGGGLSQTHLPAPILRELCARHPIVAIEAEPGDLLLFDCNLAHASGHNLSADDRRAVIVAYNTDANRPAAHRDWPLVRRGAEGAISGFRTRGEWAPQPVAAPSR
ncbi:MAG TPA: phytanoyl-CoA dioxygenase family protein [Planctomycetota bacterium]|nr:phytanoyl-CoA dioxygenase family protein [Planctomycetota bacterium]